MKQSSRKEANSFQIKTPDAPVRWNRLDVLLLCTLLLVYGILSFVHLGDRNAPQTFIRHTKNDEIVVTLEQPSEVAKVNFFRGQTITDYDVSYSLDGQQWQQVSGEKNTNVFQWVSQPIGAEAQYIKLVPQENNKAYLYEIGVFDGQERLLPIQSVTGCETPQNLTDEQDLVPALPTYENGTYFDEIYHARTAYENVHRIEPTETSHPPLGKLFIALGTMIFGMNPFGWRVMGNLFGILMIFAIYLLARRILKKPWFAFIAAFLLTFDFMHFTQTRIATIDSYPVVFILLSYYFMYCFYAGNYQKTGLRQPLIALLCSGIFFGLACASKWTGIYSGIGLAAIFFVHMAGRLREYLRAKRSGGALAKEVVRTYSKRTLAILLSCVAFFVVIPAAIYLASYIPFRFIEGHPYTFSEILDYQKNMFSYHNKLQQSHPYASMWYTWPIMYKPMWYYYQDLGGGQISTISCFGNPAVWWVGLVAFFGCLFTALKKRDGKAWFLVLAVLSQIVPWMPIARVLFIYHYFASTPFLMIMTAYMLQQVYGDLRTDKAKKRFAVVCGVYLGIVLLLFILFYPVISGMPVARDYVANVLRWFESWVFYL